MNATMLLTRLGGVRRSGAGWRANCPNPAHTRVRSSLSVIEADDGRILMSCFACHDTTTILAAIGLEMADLFPERIKDPSPEARRAAREAFKRDGWRAALNVLGREAGIVAMAAHDLLAGKSLPPPDVARLALAEERIQRAREVLA